MMAKIMFSMEGVEVKEDFFKLREEITIAQEAILKKYMEATYTMKLHLTNLHFHGFHISYFNRTLR